MQTFICLGMFMWVAKIVAKVDQRCAILSPKLERIQIFGCNPNVIIIATSWHTMCHVMSFATNMSFMTCLMQLDTIVVACDI